MNKEAKAAEVFFRVCESVVEASQFWSLCVLGYLGTWVQAFEVFCEYTCMDVYSSVHISNDEYIPYRIPDPYTTLVYQGKGTSTQDKQHIS